MVTLIAELLVELADHRVFGRFALLDLAAGKFPSPAIGFPCRPLRDQHALVGIDQGAGGDEEEAVGTAPMLRSLSSVVGVDGDVFGGEVAGPDRRAALAEAEIDADARARCSSCRRRPPLPNRPGRARPRRRRDASPNQIDEAVAVGRLAGLADRHHDAAPIGVLAGERRLHQRRIGDRERDPLRRGVGRGAGHRDLDELRQPPRRPARPAARDRGRGRRAPSPECLERRAVRCRARHAARAAAPVAKASTVSEVEVSPSMVMALKLPGNRFGRGRPAGPPAPIGASVKTKESIVAMSGAIMPAPLAMPLMHDLAAADRGRGASRPSERCRWS